MESLVVAYIGLGANLGNRENSIREAVRLMSETPGIRVLQVSRLLETSPIGPQDQPLFLNGVAAIETTLKPLLLLDCLQSIEERLGRVRGEHWGPRTIDL